MTPALERKRKLESWLFYAEGNVLDPDLADLALAVKEAIQDAKVKAYKDAASIVMSGQSYPSVHTRLLYLIHTSENEGK